MYIRPALLAALLSSAPAFAADIERDTNRTGPDVVVTATRLIDGERALKACIARKCPPKEDIAATLEHAKNLFIAGEYRAARATLLASRGRNFRYRAEFPEPVAALVLANAIVAAHLGEAQSARFESIVSLDVLKQAFAANDPRVLKARLELAYQRVRVGDLDEAITQFRTAEKLADHQPEILGTALLAQIMIADKLSASGRLDYANGLERAKKALLSANDPALAPYVATLRVVEARRAAERGDHTALDKALAAYRQYAVATKRPILIFRPTVDLSHAAAPSTDANFYDTVQSAGIGVIDSSIVRASQSDFEKQWIDVGFWINPDGSVSDPAVLRESKRGERYWEKPLLTAISGRRYAPYNAASQQFAPFRVERFTYTADYGNVTDTRIRLRTGSPKIESIDLTASNPTTRDK